MTPLIYYHFPNIFGLPHISLLDVVRHHGEGHSCGDSDSCALSFEKLFSYCCLVLFVHLRFFLFVAITLVLSSKTCDMECL